jgi:hypothetical protein
MQHHTNSPDQRTNKRIVTDHMKVKFISSGCLLTLELLLLNLTLPGQSLMCHAVLS